MEKCTGPECLHADEDFPGHHMLSTEINWVNYGSYLHGPIPDLALGDFVFLNCLKMGC
jgi:hypothetical protein